MYRTEMIVQTNGKDQMQPSFIQKLLYWIE